jgi:hypothetical protein
LELEIKSRKSESQKQSNYLLTLARQPERSTIALVSLCGIFFGEHSSRIACRISATESRDKPSRAPSRQPPGEGLSSSTVNVLWGLFNLAIGYLLVCRVGHFSLRKTQHVLVLAAGILIMSLMLAHAFGRFHGGQ